MSSVEKACLMWGLHKGRCWLAGYQGGQRWRKMGEMTQEMTVFVLGTRHSIPCRALILQEIDGVPGGGQLSGSRSSAPTPTQEGSHAVPSSSTRGLAEAGEKAGRPSAGSWAGLIRPRCTQAHIQQHPGLCVLLRKLGPPLFLPVVVSVILYGMTCDMSDHETMVTKEHSSVQR